MAVLIFTNLMLLPVLLSYVGVSPSAARAQPAPSSDEHARHGHRRAVALRSTASPTRRWALARDRGRRRCSAPAGYAVSLQLKIGDLDPGAPELRADSRYNRDNAYITAPLRAVAATPFAVIVKTPQDGCLQYETLVEADRLAWELQQVPGVQTTVSLADAVRQITAG